MTFLGAIALFMGILLLVILMLLALFWWLDSALPACQWHKRNWLIKFFRKLFL